MTQAALPLLAVFDCDGTLMDSQHSIHEGMRLAFAALGLTPPSADTIRQSIGMSLEAALPHLLQPGEEADVKRLAAAYRDQVMRIRIGSAGKVDPLYEGIVEVLQQLHDDGVALAVATGKSSRGLQQAIEVHGLGDYFTSLHAGDEYPSKPAPDMLLAAIEDCGSSARQTVMIGDTIYDMAMAKAAGTLALGVGWGYQPAAELIAQGADAIVEQVSQLPRALEGLWRVS